MKGIRIPVVMQHWIDARKGFHLSDAQVQMARELGMNPKNFGRLANHDQEPWKLPLPQFIEHLYLKNFGKVRPDTVISIEERARQKAKKKQRGVRPEPSADAEAVRKTGNRRSFWPRTGKAPEMTQVKGRLQRSTCP